MFLRLVNLVSGTQVGIRKLKPVGKSLVTDTLKINCYSITVDIACHVFIYFMKVAFHNGKQNRQTKRLILCHIVCRKHLEIMWIGIQLYIKI